MTATSAPSDGASATGHESLPLEGVRVLDFTIVWAGPMCTRILSDLGAEVIKVEGIDRPDPERGPRVAPDGPRYPGGIAGERPYNRAGRFNEYNRGKSSVILDLKQPEGLELARELVRVSDIVVENFSAGVLDRLGLGYEDLVKLRPDIIYLSMQGFGSHGPEAQGVAYGPTQEAMSGLSNLTGYADGPPMLTGVFYGDPMGGTASAVAAVMALWRRRQTGLGGRIDLSQQEALLGLLPEVMFEYDFNDRILGPQGNRHPSMAPHGCYPCAGDDAWIVITVEDEAQWRGLCEVMARPDLVGDPRFATLLARLRAQDALDAIVSEWTRTQDKYAAMHALQAAGVAAEAVLYAGEVISDPQYVERGFFQAIPHPEAGTHPHASAAWRLEDGFLPVRRAAPCFGEHNVDVLGGLLGHSDEELERLLAAGVVGTVPGANAGARGRLIRAAT